MFIVFCSYSLHSKRFARIHRESWDKSKKEKWWVGGREGNVCLKNRTILKNCVRPWTQLLIGAVLVLLINSDQYITQTRYVLFTYTTNLVWTDLWLQITNALDWYLLESCLCKGLSVMANLLQMTACGSDWKNGPFVGDNKRKSENWYSTQAQDAMDKRYVNFLKWKDSFWQKRFDKG